MAININLLSRAATLQESKLGQSVKTIVQRARPVRNSAMDFLERHAPGSKPVELQGQGRSEVRIPGPMRRFDELSEVDWKAEAAFIDEALAGNPSPDNPWRDLAQFAKPKWRYLAADLKRSIGVWSPDHVEEIYARGYNAVLERHLNVSAPVQQYVDNLCPMLERGPVFHGNGLHIAVPKDAPHGTLVDVAQFMSILQGRAPSSNGLREKLISFLVNHRLTRALGHKLEGEGLAFKRAMLTPIKEDDALDGGYSIINLKKIAPILGGMPAFEHLMSVANGRKFELVLDNIKNHNSYLHERTQALKKGDFSRAQEHVNWSGVGKVGEVDRNGQTFSVLVHTGEDAGAVSLMWAIFKDSNPDGVVRVRAPVTGKWKDLELLKSTVGDTFALDEQAQKEVVEIFERYGLPEVGEDSRRWLPDQATAQLKKAREENNARALTRIQSALDAGETPYAELDLVASFKGGVQYDKNMSHPEVFQEEIDGDVMAALLGQSGGRDDAIIHLFKKPGTDQLDLDGSREAMRSFALFNEQMTPNRTLIPEAYLPREIVQSAYLNAHIPLPDGTRHAAAGNLAIDFDVHTNVNTAKVKGGGDLSLYEEHINNTRKQEGDLGESLGAVVRLHDEAHIKPEVVAEKKAAGELVDPMLFLEELAKKRPLSIPEALEALKTELHRLQDEGILIDFENRAAGDDPSQLLKNDPDQISQAIAMGYADTPIPAISYRLLARQGNNIDFAVSEMGNALQKQLDVGEPLNFRKAWDSRLLGRGHVGIDDWKRLLKAKDPVLATTRAGNQLWNSHATFRSRDARIIATPDKAVSVVARQGTGGSPPLLSVFNDSAVPKRLKLSKQALQETLGWKADGWSRASFRDVLAFRMHAKRGERPQDKYKITQDGDGNIEITLPPMARAFLERRERLNGALHFSAKARA